MSFTDIDIDRWEAAATTVESLFRDMESQVYAEQELYRNGDSKLTNADTTRLTKAQSRITQAYPSHLLAEVDSLSSMVGRGHPYPL